MLRRSPRQLRSRYEVITPTIARTSQYSVERRTLCNLDAMARLPTLPPICPLCQIPGTRFKIYIAYKDDCAGWWCILCKGCQRVDVPLQVGPPADLAALIDARVELEAATEDEKREKKEEKKALAAVDKLLKQERKTAKAAQKKAKEEEKEAARAVKARKRDAAHLAFLEKAGEDEGRREKVTAGRKKGVKKQGPHAIISKREIQVTLWHQGGKKPLVVRVEVPNASQVHVMSLAPVIEHLQPGRFVEHWDLDDARWTPSEATAQVSEGAPSLLVRFTDIKYCIAFGLHVHLLQDGSATTAYVRKRAIIDAKRTLKAAEQRAELTDHAWVVLWAHDNKMPLVGRLALDAKRRVDLTSTFVLKRTFEDLNVDSVHVWNAYKTDWQEYTVNELIPVLGCDTLVARVPDVEKLTYFGVEVLAHQFRLNDRAGLTPGAKEPTVVQQPEASSSAQNATLKRATAAINWVY